MEVTDKAARLFEAGDWDGFTTLFTEEVSLWALEGWPEPGPFFGRTAVVDEFRRLQESWGANQVLIEDRIERDDWLVARFRWIVTGASSGVPGDMTIFAAVRFEDQLIAEWRSYWHHDQALAAAGMDE